MERITILLCLFCVAHVWCSPTAKLSNSSIENVHDKRSIGSLLMPLISGMTSDSGAGGGVLGLLGSLITSQITGGGGGNRGSNSRPVQDHFSAASSANGFNGGRSMSAAVTSHRGPGLGFNFDLGRIGSNLISGFNAGKQFGNTGGALLGSFLQSGMPQQPQQPRRPFQENHFSNGGMMDEGGFDKQPHRGSGSSFRQGNSVLPPPQSFQDELPRDFHSRGRPNVNMSPFPPSPPPAAQPQQQIDFANNPSVPPLASPLNEFNMPQQFNVDAFSHSMAQQPQQQFGNQEQQQVEQPQFEENVSTVASTDNNKRKPGQRSRKRKPTKSQVQTNEEFPNADSTGNRELSVQSNPSQNSQVINDQQFDPNFFNRPSPFSDSSFNPQQLQNQQQFQAATGPLPGDSSAFASNNFPTQMQQLAPSNSNVRETHDNSRGPNYAHSVPVAFDNYGERFPGNSEEVWLADEDETSDDATF